METKKYFVLAGYLLLILVVGVACNDIDAKRGGILSASKVMGYPLRIAGLQAISGVSMLGEPSPWIVITSGGNSIELWSSMITEQDSTLWPALSWDKFQNEGFAILTGEVKLHVRHITWAIIISKTN